MSGDFFYGRKLVILAIGFGAGILCARYILGMEGWLLAAFFLLCALALFFFGLRRTALFAFAFALGLSRLQLAYPALPAPEDTCALSGRVFSVQGEGPWQLTLDNASHAGYSIDGKVLLHVPKWGMAQVPQYGDWIQADASIRLPQGIRNAGGMDMRFYYFTKGIVAQAQAGRVRVLPGETDLIGHMRALRTWTTQTLIALIGEENGALAAAMIHGEDENVPDGALRAFRGAGIAHLLAVSGLHVSILTGALLLLLRRARPWARLLITGGFLLLYCMFTAFSASTVRASIMALCLLLASALGRRNDGFCSLSLAFLLILLVSPFQLFSVGFQLSFSAVCGILLISPLFSRKGGPFLGGVGVSIGAQAGTLPATAAYFQSLPLLALPANLLVVPLAALALIPSLIALPLSLFSQGAARAIAGVSDVTLHLMRAVAGAVADVGSVALPAFSIGAALAFALFFLFLSKYCFLSKALKAVLCGVCALLCAAMLFLPRVFSPARYIAVLELPQGYAAHVHSPQGDTLYCDDLGQKSAALRAYLTNQGIVEYTLEQGAREGAQIHAWGQQLSLVPGKLEIGGAAYETAENGQLLLAFEEDGVHITGFAQEDRYAILIQEDHAIVQLEELWNSGNSFHA